MSTVFYWPDQLQKRVDLLSSGCGAFLSEEEAAALAGTLTAYASVVQAVAERVWCINFEDDAGHHFACFYCDSVSNGLPSEIDHAPDCLYLRARKLRGLE